MNDLPLYVISCTMSVLFTGPLSRQSRFPAQVKNFLFTINFANRMLENTFIHVTTLKIDLYKHISVSKQRAETF